MSFFHKKMSQNVWATIMSFGPVTNFLLAQNKIFGLPSFQALWSDSHRAVFCPNFVVSGWEN
jgi:hypothetical protein